MILTLPSATFSSFLLLVLVRNEVKRKFRRRVAEKKREKWGKKKNFSEFFL